MSCFAAFPQLIKWLCRCRSRRSPPKMVQVFHIFVIPSFKRRRLHLCQVFIFEERHVVNPLIWLIVHSLYLDLSIAGLIFISVFVLFAERQKQRQGWAQTCRTAQVWRLKQMCAPFYTVSSESQGTPACRWSRHLWDLWPPRTRWATGGFHMWPALPGWGGCRWIPGSNQSAGRRC